SERNREIVSQRLGLEGQEPSTLQAVADQFGLTRERVRQVSDRLKARLASRRPSTAALNRAIQLIAKEVPGLADDIEFKLAAEAITSRRFRLEALRNAIEIVGGKPPFVVTQLGNKRFAAPARKEHIANRIVTIARKSVNQQSAVMISDIASQAQNLTQVKVSE